MRVSFENGWSDLGKMTSTTKGMNKPQIKPESDCRKLIKILRGIQWNLYSRETSIHPYSCTCHLFKHFNSGKETFFQVPNPGFYLCSEDNLAVEKYLTIKSVNKFKCTQTHNEFHNININCLTRWLDTVFQVLYLKSFSINYKALKNDLQNLPLQLCKMKMKSCYDQGCNDTGVVIGTNWHHYLFYLQHYFSSLGITVLWRSFTGALFSNSHLYVCEV